jgi:hypothetical protein
MSFAVAAREIEGLARGKFLTPTVDFWLEINRFGRKSL